MRKRLSSRHDGGGLRSLEDQYVNQEKLLKIKQRKMNEEKAKIKKPDAKIKDETKRQAGLYKNKKLPAKERAYKILSS